MHELGIVFHIIRGVEEVGRKNRVKRVSAVTLQLGEVSGVVEHYLQDCWRWAADRSDLLRGAQLPGGNHPCPDPVRGLRRDLSHCAPRQNLSGLWFTADPPAARQRDAHQGDRGA